MFINVYTVYLYSNAVVRYLNKTNMDIDIVCNWVILIYGHIVVIVYNNELKNIYKFTL